MEPTLKFRISDDVRTKLKDKHYVTEREIHQCFCNRDGGLLEDPREVHKTNPPTEWFIAPTNKGRMLKVCFVQVGHDIDIKTAFEADQESIRIYNKFAY